MLTRSGLGAVISALVLATLGLWWNYEELVIVAIGVGLVVLMAIVVARRPLRASVERRVRTIRVPRGDPVRVTYRVRNDTSYRSGRATLIDRCDGQEVTLDIDPVIADDVIDVPSTLPTRRRGVFELGPLDISKIDPFYLAAGRWRQDEESTSLVTVHPKVYEMIGPQGSSRVIENESIVRRAAADPMSGFVSMREYVAGDDPRMIHWPTTARTGTLMVREHVEIRRPEFTIVVDAAATVASEDDFEEMIDAAASLAVHALRTGLDVVVRTTNRDHAGRPTALVSEAEVLDLLTPTRQTADEPMPVAALFTQGLGHTSVLLVTGPDGPATRLSANDQMVIIRIGDGARSGAGVGVAARDAPDFVNRWRSWS
jgi:uncharacterized protein (DUF58 family)